MTSVFTRDTQVSRRVNLRHHFEFSQKNPDLETRLLLSCAHDLGTVISKLLRNPGRKANLKTIKSCSNILELGDN